MAVADAWRGGGLGGWFVVLVVVLVACACMCVCSSLLFPVRHHPFFAEEEKKREATRCGAPCLDSFTEHVVLTDL